MVGSVTSVRLAFPMRWHRGMSQTGTARTFGVSLQAVNTWMRLDREGSLRVLTLNRRRRHSGEYRLSAKRAAVASLTARDYGIAVSLVTVGRYLRAWGLGLEPADAGAARLREEPSGHHVVAEAGISDNRPAGQAGTHRHLLGRRKRVAQ
jgi:transposase